MSSIYGKGVVIYHYVPDLDQPVQTRYDNSRYQPTKRVILGTGMCVGLGTTYEQLGDAGNYYCGQYTVMIVIRSGKFEEHLLSNIEEVQD